MEDGNKTLHKEVEEASKQEDKAYIWDWQVKVIILKYLKIINLKVSEWTDIKCLTEKCGKMHGISSLLFLML